MGVNAILRLRIRDLDLTEQLVDTRKGSRDPVPRTS